MTWTVTSGSLPTGLTLSSLGVISGSPTTAGTFNFTVTVTDSASHTATGNLSITINAKLTITTPAGTLPTVGEAGGAFTATTLTETGGVGPFAWVINSGSLPGGLSLSGTGSITGTISASAVPGTFSFTAKVTDSQGNVVISGTISIKVDAALTITPPTLPIGVVNVNYSSPAFTAAGGSGSGYSFAVASGSLPSPLIINSGTGIISGIPAASGISTFAVKVTDSLGYSVTTSNLSITIDAPPVITSANSTSFTAGAAGSFTVTTTGFPTPALAETVALPSGVTFTDNKNGTGTLAWTTAVASGSYGLTFTASNGVLPNTTQSFTLSAVVVPASVTAATGSGQSATISTAFTTALQATVKDASGNLVPNVTVTFTAPSSGASGTFANGTATTTATTNSSGLATASAFTANSTSGTYSVMASAPGVSATASFNLTNNPVPGLQINSLSETTGYPFDVLTITGSGFDSATTVNFSSSLSGFSANIQPVFVSQTSLIVPVPALSIGGTFSSGTVNVAVVESLSQSNNMQLQIAAVPPAPPSAPGTVTLGFLQGELGIANQLSSEVTTGPVSSDLTALISTLNAVIPQIQSVVDGDATSVNLGDFNGQPVIVGATELAQMDRLSLAFLQSLANSSGSGSISALTHRGNSVYERAAAAAQTPGTGCLSVQAALNSEFEVAASGATASQVAAGIEYLNQGLGTSSEGADFIIHTLESAPAAVLLVSSAGVLAVPGSIVLAAEIFENLSDLFKIVNYVGNPTPGSSDETQFFQTLMGRFIPGPTGKILSLATDADNTIKDLPTVLYAPLPSQAAACVSVLTQNFGTETLGVPSATQSVTVTSSGTLPLTIASATVGGPIPGQSRDFQLASDGCSNTTLPTGSTCTVTDFFIPSLPQNESAALGITGNFPASPIVIGLSGMGSVVSTGVDSLTPATLPLGTLGGCAGSTLSLSGTFNIQPASGVTWTASLSNFPNPPPQRHLEPGLWKRVGDHDGHRHLPCTGSRPGIHVQRHLFSLLGLQPVLCFIL